MPKLTDLIKSLLGQLYPDDLACIQCRREIKPNPYGTCGDCALTTNDGKVCLKCGTPINVDSDYCLNCPTTPNHYTTARSALIYTDELHGLIHAVKFGHAEWILKYLAAHMCDLFETLSWDIDIVVPVPLSPAKLKKRGFNQSEVLANIISAQFDLPLNTNVLAKIRDTADQATLSRAKRMKNLEGAYVINPDTDLRGKNILLIDDLITTGTTANLLSQLIKSKKANKVYVLTLATPKRKLAKE